MRVLLINTSERIGGAAIAASRLKDALKSNGIEATLLVRDKQTKETSVIALHRNGLQTSKFVWERIVIWTYNRFSKKNLFSVSIANTGNDITCLPEFQEADVIHLHWINQGMLSLKDLKKIFASGKPIIWTMHDMWACTGICHHARTCTHYETECKYCPYLWKNGSKKDLSYRIFRRKKKLYKDANITFVSCSQWLEEQTRKSALITGHNVISIPNPINTNTFKPENIREAREKLNLPLDKKLILFGSVKVTNKRKGLTYLIDASKILIDKYPALKDKIGFVVIGQKSSYLDSILPFPVFTYEFIQDEKKIIDIYNGVDLFVTPSLEENLPNMIMEAMACGVPCVGFQTGGIPEMIDHLQNGYIAEYESAEDLANGMYCLLEKEATSFQESARNKVLACYSESVVAKQYIDTYKKITEIDK